MTACLFIYRHISKKKSSGRQETQKKPLLSFPLKPFCKRVSYKLSKTSPEKGVCPISSGKVNHLLRLFLIQNNADMSQRSAEVRISRVQ